MRQAAGIHARWHEMGSAFRRHRVRLLGALTLALTLAPLLLALPARAHQTGTGDLMSAVPLVNETDISGDFTRKHNACGVAAARMLLDYYLPLGAQALTLDAVSQYVKEQWNISPDGSKAYGTDGQQIQDGVVQASTAADLGVNVPLTDSWNYADQNSWLPTLKAELDAKLPVIVFLDDGSVIDNMNHYGHIIVVSGYTANDDIIVHDPWYVQGDPLKPSKTIPNATFARAWGATWGHNQTPFAYLEVLPPGTPSPIPTTTGTTVSDGPTSTPSVPPGTVTEFALTTPNSQPNGIAKGPDGNIWFTQSSGGNVVANPSGGCSCVGSIGRITPSGAVTVFADRALVNSGDGVLQPEGITLGSDGTLWYVMADGFGFGYAGHIAPDGTITELPTFTTDGTTNINGAASIAAGPDGNLWFTYYNIGSGGPGGVGRIGLSGEITAFPLSDPTTQLGGITMGPDGNLWFSESSGIGRISPNGTITQYPLDQSIAAPAGISRGPDGNLWFAEQNGIGRITPNGTITSFALPQPNSAPDSVTAGPDGNLWFTENHGIGRITPAGAVTVFPVSSSFATSGPNIESSSHQGITVGPNGNLWFIDPVANKIGEITP